MSLIDVVKDSLDANGITYTWHAISMPTNALIAHPNIKGDVIDCLICTKDVADIVVVEFPFGPSIDPATENEALAFILEANKIASLGQLTLDCSLVVTYKDGLKVEYLADPQKSIAAFIVEAGEIALTFFTYIHSIVNKGSTAEIELDLLDGHCQLPFNALSRIN